MKYNTGYGEALFDLGYNSTDPKFGDKIMPLIMHFATKYPEEFVVEFRKAYPDENLVRDAIEKQNS